MAKQTVAAVRVVNDWAECATCNRVQLCTDKDEQQRQLSFQVVEYHRKQITAPTKRKFIEIYDTVVNQWLSRLLHNDTKLSYKQDTAVVLS